MNKKETALVILSAGIGSRFGGLKQLAPISKNGEMIIDYSIYDAIKTGFSKIVFVIRHDIEGLFREKISRKYEGKIRLEYVYQDIPSGRTKPMGTAHAVYVCNKTVNCPFAVINADDFYGRDSFKILYSFLQNNANVNNYAMVGFYLKNTLSENGYVARGICDVSHNLLRKVVEREKIGINNNIIEYLEHDNTKKKLNPDVLVSMNMFGFYPAVFAFIEEKLKLFIDTYKNDSKKEFFIPTVIDELISKGKIKVSVLSTNEKWMGITYSEDKPLVENEMKKLILSGKYPRNLW